MARGLQAFLSDMLVSALPFPLHGDNAAKTAAPPAPAPGAGPSPRADGFRGFIRDERTAAPLPVYDRFTLGETAQTDTGGLKMGLAGEGDKAAPAGSAPYTFGDVIDMINPLQHIPILGNIYRSITGDEIKPFSRIVGGALFGGPVGAAVSTANVVATDRTGRDLAGNARALFQGEPIGGPRTPDLNYAKAAETRANINTQPSPGSTLNLNA